MTWNAAVYCTPVVRDSLIVFAALNVDLQAAAKTPLRFGLPQGRTRVLSSRLQKS
jgi:hypothetical protein